jgi:hypothetical protein
MPSVDSIVGCGGGLAIPCGASMSRQHGLHRHRAASGRIPCSERSAARRSDALGSFPPSAHRLRQSAQPDATTRDESGGTGRKRDSAMPVDRPQGAQQRTPRPPREEHARCDRRRESPSWQGGGPNDRLAGDRQARHVRQARPRWLPPGTAGRRTARNASPQRYGIATTNDASMA